MITTKRGQRTQLPSNEPVECPLSTTYDRGVQIIAEGFDLSNATITVTYPNSEVTEVLRPIQEGVASVKVGMGMVFSKVQIEDASGGYVTFLQP